MPELYRTKDKIFRTHTVKQEHFRKGHPDRLPNAEYKCNFGNYTAWVKQRGTRLRLTPEQEVLIDVSTRDVILLRPSMRELLVEKVEQ
jgi:hypothetical protein